MTFLSLGAQVTVAKCLRDNIVWNLGQRIVNRLVLGLFNVNIYNSHYVELNSLYSSVEAIFLACSCVQRVVKGAQVRGTVGWIVIEGKGN